jgi:hypothetical protein
MEMNQTKIVVALPIVFFLVFAMTIIPTSADQTSPPIDLARDPPILPPSVQRFSLMISWFDCDNTTGGGNVTGTYGNFYIDTSSGYEFSGANYWGFVYYQVSPVIVEVVAHPTDGWFLQNWTLDGVDIGNSAEIEVVTGCGLIMNLVATFNPLGTPPPTYTLTINSESCNSETLPSDCTTAPSSRVYAFTQTTMVTANAGIGWLFNNWILDGQTVGDFTDNPISVSFDSQNHTLIAVFNPIPVLPPTPTNYTLTISREAGGNNKFAFGTTDPAGGVYSYLANTQVTVTVYAYGEWYLEKWIFDGQDYANTTTFQVLMDTNHTLVAVFVPPSLIADVNGDGIVNTVDARIVENAFLSKPGDSNWNPIADLNHDGVVGILDAMMVSKDFGKNTLTSIG